MNMEYIDNTYVINMDSSKDRLKRMEDQKPILGGNFTRISAVVGKNLTDAELTQNTTRSCSLFCTKSMIGCFLSHKKTWETVIKNNDRYALIMEDDCSLEENFQDTLRNTINDLNTQDPEWDFLYGGCFGACKPDKDYGVLATLMKYTSKSIQQRPTNSNHFFIPEVPVGFHCYIISQKCARKLVKALGKASYHVDYAFVNNSDDFKIYACTKSIGYQFSTTKNSTLATINFPVILNRFFDKQKDTNGISTGYYLNSHMGRVSFFPINFYYLFVILFSIIFPKKPFLTVLGTYLTAEFIINPGNIKYILVWLSTAILLNIITPF